MDAHLPCTSSKDAIGKVVQQRLWLCSTQVIGGIIDQLS